MNYKLGDHEENIKYLSSQPFLLKLYLDIVKDSSLYLLGDDDNNISPEELEKVLLHIQNTILHK